MEMKILMTVCMLPILAIMYGVLWFLAGEKNGYLFGIKKWKEDNFENKTQELMKQYRKKLNLWAVALLLAFLVTCIPSHFSLMLLGQMLWTFAVIILMFIPFAQANLKMKEWKREYRNQSQEKGLEGSTSERFVDVTAAGTEKPRFFVKGTVVAVVLGLLPPLLEVIVRDSLTNPAAPDLWLTEVVLVSMGLIAPLCLVCVSYFNRQGTKALTMNSQVNIQISRVQQYQLGKFFAVMAWISTLYTWCMWGLLRIFIEGVVWGILAITFVYTALVIGMGIRCWLAIRRTCAKYLQSEEILPDDAEEEYWIWGLIYYNKKDQRFLVEQRVGIGMACNMAKSASKLLVGVIGTFCLALVLGLGAWLILDDFTPVYLSYQSGNLVSGQWKEEYKVPEADVSEVTLLEEKINISKRSGTGMDTVQKGDFFSREYERGFNVCINPKEAPFLMIGTKDGKWYLLGDSNGENTREIYQELLLDMGK